MTTKELAAMKLALEALELHLNGCGVAIATRIAYEALREALAGPQITTPDVCGEVCVRAKLCYGCNKDLEEANAKFAEQAEQEPVGYMVDGEFTRYRSYAEEAGGFALYAAPVRTKDLTDDEVAKVYMECTGGDIIARCRAVIAADREKNK